MPTYIGELSTLTTYSFGLREVAIPENLGVPCAHSTANEVAVMVSR
jgi:hypothetical protein